MNPLNQGDDDLLRRVAELEASNAAQFGVAEPAPEQQPSYPTLESADPAKEALKRLDMPSLYRSTFHPKSERTSGQGILISCFNHIAHPRGDINPGLEITQKSGVWVYRCHACGIGGDNLDILAARYGALGAGNRIDRSKTNTVVGHAVDEYMPGRYYFSTAKGSWEAVSVAQPPGVTVDPTTQFPVFEMGTGSGAAPLAHTDSESGTPASVIDPISEELGLNHEIPSLDWRNIFKPGSFMREYLELGSAGHSVEEFHDYNAFMALGMVTGRSLALADGDRPVYGNAYMCMVGASAKAGKSAAFDILRDVIRYADPYIESSGEGVKMPGEPGSGEAFVESFRQEIDDPAAGVTTFANGKPKQVSPKTFVDDIVLLQHFDEISSLMARSDRVGDTTSSILLELYGCPWRISGGNTIGRGERIAYYPYGSVIGGAQPGLLADLMKKKQVRSGLANRFMFVMGPLKQRSMLNTRRKPIGPLVELLKERITWARDLAAATRPAAGTVAGPSTTGPSAPWTYEIPWDPDAITRIEAFGRSTIFPALDGIDGDGDLFGRLDLLYKKHVLWLTIDARSDTVTAETVAQAELMWPYMFACYVATAGHVTAKSERSEEEADVLAAIERLYRRNGQWPTRRELQRGPMQGISADQLGRIMDALVKYEVLRELVVVHPSGKGRPTTRFEIIQDA